MILDSQGNLYVASGTARADFPITQGVYSHAGQNLDVVIAALNPTGTGVLFSTVIGGQGNDHVRTFARDSAGNLYISGNTTKELPSLLTNAVLPSYDFPVTQNAYQTAFGSGFLLELSSDATTLRYSTFLGTTPSTVGADLGDPLQPLTMQFGLDGKLRMLASSYRSDLRLTPDSLDPCYPDFFDSFSGQHWVYARFSTDLRSIEYATAVPMPRVDQQPFFVDPADKLYIASVNNYFDILDLAKQVPPGPTCLSGTTRQTETTIAPGLLVSIYGPHIGPEQPATGAPDSNGIIASRLAGTQVLFGGIPAPILYTSSSRVDTVVPFGVATSGVTTKVSVLKDGSLLGTLTNQIEPTSIRLFSTDGSGYGSVVWNQDGTPNTPTNPANRGDILTLYGTGMGAMTPQVADGLVPMAPTASVVTSLGPGFPFSVLYAGDAPGEIEGVVQINCQVTENARSGLQSFAFYFGTANLGDQHYYFAYVK